MSAAFSRRLKQLRADENLNQKDMAAALGINRSTYAGYETDREPDIETLIHIARHFGVTVDYLVGASDVPFAPYDMSYDEVEYISRSLELYRKIKNEYLLK